MLNNLLENQFTLYVVGQLLFARHFRKFENIYIKRVWDKSLTLNIKSEQNELSDTQNSVLFAFLSNLLIFKIYNKEFLKSKSFCPRLYLHCLNCSIIYLRFLRLNLNFCLIHISIRIDVETRFEEESNIFCAKQS